MAGALSWLCPGTGRAPAAAHILLPRLPQTTNQGRKQEASACPGWLGLPKRRGRATQEAMSVGQTQGEDPPPWEGALKGLVSCPATHLCLGQAQKCEWRSKFHKITKWVKGPKNSKNLPRVSYLPLRELNRAIHSFSTAPSTYHTPPSSSMGTRCQG